MARTRSTMKFLAAITVCLALRPLWAAEPAPAAKTAPPSITQCLQAVEDSGTVQAALDALGKGLADYPDNPKLLSTYVRKAVDLGDPDAAFKQSMLLNYLEPKDGLAWGVMAHVHASRGDLNTAWIDIATAVSLLPRDPFIQRTAGELLALYDTTHPAVTEAQKTMVEQIRLAMAWQKSFVDAYRSAKMVLEVANQKPAVPSTPVAAPIQPVAPLPPAVQPATPLVQEQPAPNPQPADDQPVILPGQKEPIRIGTPMGGDIQPPVIVNNNYYQYTPPMQIIDAYWPGYGFVQAYSSWYPYLDPIWVFVPPLQYPCPPRPCPPRPYPPRPLHPQPLHTGSGSGATASNTIPVGANPANTLSAGRTSHNPTFSQALPISPTKGFTGYVGVSGYTSSNSQSEYAPRTSSSSYRAVTTPPSLLPITGVLYQGNVGIYAGGARR